MMVFIWVRRAGTTLCGALLATVVLAGCGFLNSGSMVAPVQMTVSSQAFGQGHKQHAGSADAPEPRTAEGGSHSQGGPVGTGSDVLAFDIVGDALRSVRSVINPDKLGHLGYPLSPIALTDSSPTRSTVSKPHDFSGS